MNVCVENENKSEIHFSLSCSVQIGTDCAFELKRHVNRRNAMELFFLFQIKSLRSAFRQIRMTQNESVVDKNVENQLIHSHCKMRTKHIWKFSHFNYYFEPSTSFYHSRLCSGSQHVRQWHVLTPTDILVSWRDFFVFQ